METDDGLKRLRSQLNQSQLATFHSSRPHPRIPHCLTDHDPTPPHLRPQLFPDLFTGQNLYGKEIEWEQVRSEEKDPAWHANFGLGDVMGGMLG